MLQIFKYQENPIQFEVMDGKVMANATLMSKVFGKRPVDWLRTDQAKRYVAALSEVHKCTSADLVIVRKGGMEQGTWIHEKLILPLARFLSVDFELWCDERLAEMFRIGITSVDGKFAKVMNAIIAMAESMKIGMESLQMQINEMRGVGHKNVSPTLRRAPVDVIDARHRTYQTTEINGGQVRSIKLDDKNYYLMADVLMLKGCRTSTGQYAATLNRSGDKMAVKIWLFAQPREAWFVSEDGLKLLLSR